MEKTESMNYIVVAVKPIENYVLLVDFIDGTKKRFDMKPIIDRGGVFDKLKEKEKFMTAHVDRDTVVWDDILDIAPESLYEKGEPIL